MSARPAKSSKHFASSQWNPLSLLPPSFPPGGQPIRWLKILPDMITNNFWKISRRHFPSVKQPLKSSNIDAIVFAWPMLQTCVCRNKWSPAEHVQFLTFFRLPCSFFSNLLSILSLWSNLLSIFLPRCQFVPLQSIVRGEKMFGAFPLRHGSLLTLYSQLHINTKLLFVHISAAKWFAFVHKLN